MRAIARLRNWDNTYGKLPAYRCRLARGVQWTPGVL